MRKLKNISTLRYLETINKDCPDNLRCQHYFCATEFPDKKCPIVDIYTKKLIDNYQPDDIQNKNEDSPNQNNQLNQSKINMIPRYNIMDITNIQIKTSSIYDRNFNNKNTFEDTILLPIIDLLIVGNGKCNLKQQNQIYLDYSTITNIECPIDQHIHNFYSSDIKQILNSNDNYYDYLDSKLPLFDILVNKDVKWSLGLEYAFHRKTLTCLFEKYDKLNNIEFFSKIEKKNNIITNFDIKKEKLKNLLILFINFNSNYKFQDGIQLSILIINSLVIFFNIVIIIHKLILLWIPCDDNINMLFSYEYIFSFIFDVIIAILGAVSYFILGKFVDYFENILKSDCIDNYIQYQFTVFSDSLQNTLNQNFQIFIFMIFKIFLIFIHILYYSLYRNCKCRCSNFKRVIIENLNEGENNIDIVELRTILKGDPDEKIPIRISSEIKPVQ